MLIATLRGQKANGRLKVVKSSYSTSTSSS